MSRRAWDLIKHSKRFYVRSYRRAGSILFISMILNVCLGIVIYYVYANLPESDFYATYGEVPPIPLNPMSEPNNSSVPLLSTNSNQDSDIRVIPQ